MKLVATGLSDVGLQREHNEDSYQLISELGLYLVADGMGGHRAGAVASKMATEAIAAFFRSTANEDATWPFQFDPNLSIEENRLISGIKLANRQIYEASARNNEVQGMGTTIVGVLYSEPRQKLYVGHVGDSRCYRTRDAKIQLLTRDHSLVNDYLLAMPDLTDEQREELPKNVITRALGMQESVVVDMQVDQPQVGDVYLLCSDGLSGMISDEDLEKEIVGHESVEETARALIAKANARGGEDNITALLIKVVAD